MRQVQYNQEVQTGKELQDKYNYIISYLTKNKSKKALTCKKALIDSQKYWQMYVSYSCYLEAMPASETPRGSDPFYRECTVDKSKQRLVELNKLDADIRSALGE